ncbi:MAG: hypothetical protein ACO1TE_00685 [Prosthecobacter sp.]
MKSFLLPLFLATCVCLAADGDLVIQGEKGLQVVIPAAEAKVLKDHNHWLGERLKEAGAIQEGGTYADVLKHFKVDGGLHGGKTVRFVHHLAWNLKIDIVFDGDFFKNEDPGLKIKSVSHPYLDAGRID